MRFSQKLSKTVGRLFPSQNSGQKWLFLLHRRRKEEVNLQVQWWNPRWLDQVSHFCTSELLLKTTVNQNQWRCTTYLLIEICIMSIKPTSWRWSSWAKICSCRPTGSLLRSCIPIQHFLIISFAFSWIWAKQARSHKRSLSLCHWAVFKHNGNDAAS